MAEQPLSNKFTLDLSWWSVIRIISVPLIFYLLFLIRDILAIMFVVFIIVAALNPVIARMQLRMPRIVAVTLTYFGLFIVLITVSTVLFQPLAVQISNLAEIIPDKVNSVMPFFEQLKNGNDLVKDLSTNLQQFSGTITTFSGNLIDTTLGIFGGIFTVFTVMVLTFYLLLEEAAAKQFLDNILVGNQKDRVMGVLQKISNKMGAWVRGQLMLMLIIGVLDLVILLILGVESPLPLALWGGLMEVIPYLGPILGALPAVVVALVTGSTLQALLVAIILIVVVQQIEGQFLVPKVMQKAVGLSPVIVILALLIGGKLMGVLGALLAIPIAAIIAVLVQQWGTLQKAFNTD